MKSLVSLLNEGKVTERLGIEFFSSSTPARKELLEYLLDKRAYEQVCKLIHYGHIVKQYRVSDYVMHREGNKFDIEAAYFSLLTDIVFECNISDDKMIPLIFATATAKKEELLRGWEHAARVYLTKIAYKNFEYAFDNLIKYDKKLQFLSVLTKVDRAHAVNKMLELALFGKNFDKTALRKFLRDYENDVIAYIKPIYHDLKAYQRESAVRLLLLYKNSVPAAMLIGELCELEKSKTVLKLIEKDFSVKSDESGTIDDPTEFFFDAMINGRAFSYDAFMQLITDVPYREVAEQLFFAIYNAQRIIDLFVVDNGRINDLNNQPIKLAHDCAIKVLHPIEIPLKYAFIKQLNVTQPFNQLNRRIFETPTGARYTNSALKGTLIKAGSLKRNFSKYGFKILNRDIDGICTQAGVLRNEILCVINFTPTDFIDKELLLTIGDVQFYSYAETVKLNGRIYVDGVPICSAGKILPLDYSELMHCVYEAVGQI